MMWRFSVVESAASALLKNLPSAGSQSRSTKRVPRRSAGSVIDACSLSGHKWSCGPACRTRFSILPRVLFGDLPDTMARIPTWGKKMRPSSTT